MSEVSDNPQADLRHETYEFVYRVLLLKELNNKVVLPSILQPIWVKIFIFLLVCGGAFYAFYALTSASLLLSITLAITSTSGGFGFLLGIAAMVIWLRGKYRNSHDTFDKLFERSPNEARNFFEDYDELLSDISDRAQEDSLPADLTNEVQQSIDNRNDLSLSQIQALFEKLTTHYNFLAANRARAPQSSYMTSVAESCSQVSNEKSDNKQQSPPQMIEMASTSVRADNYRSQKDEKVNLPNSVDIAP